MATVHIDTLTTLEMRQRPRGDGGDMITELRRMARVVDLPHNADNYEVLQEALDSINLNIGSTPEGHFDLILAERTARLIPGEIDKVDVELRYEQRGRTLDSVPPGTYIIEGQSRLQQMRSQRDNVIQQAGPEQGLGRKLVVYHCFPSDYEGQDKWAGQRVPQVGDVSVAMPQESFTLIARYVAAHPEWDMRDRVGYINDAPWQDLPAGTWLCTEGTFTPHFRGIDHAFDVWEFRYLVQNNLLGWNPDVWFRDPTTGRQPINLNRAPHNMLGNNPPSGPPGLTPCDIQNPPLDLWGEYTVDWYITTDFDLLFPIT